MTADPIPVMTREEAVDFFAEIYRGKHHIPAPRYYGEHGVRQHGGGIWYVNHYGDLASVDHDDLTRAVVLAHDRCFRLAILPSGPRMLQVVIAKRARDGCVATGHPTIEEFLAKWREGHPAP